MQLGSGGESSRCEPWGPLANHALVLTSALRYAGYDWSTALAVLGSIWPPGVHSGKRTGKCRAALLQAVLLPHSPRSSLASAPCMLLMHTCATHSSAAVLAQHHHDKGVHTGVRT